jgi:hypothetical protein
VDTTNVSCNIGILKEDNTNLIKIHIKTFPRYDHDAGVLGRHLAEACLDLNKKICDIDVKEWRSTTVRYLRCRECDFSFFGAHDWYVAADTIKHIIDEHPMKSLTKSAGKT